MSDILQHILATKRREIAEARSLISDSEIERRMDAEAQGEGVRLYFTHMAIDS